MERESHRTVSDIVSVLFVCTGNSCRSPMAEAILHHTVPTVNVRSAGTSPATAFSPYTISTLAEHGLALLSKDPGDVRTLRHHEYSHVISLSDDAEDFCKEAFNSSVHRRWYVDDPFECTGDESARRVAYEHCFLTIQQLVHTELCGGVELKSGDLK